MFAEEPSYEYSKDGPLSHSRVAGKPAAPEKDILATYDEIFAWGDNEEKKEAPHHIEEGAQSTVQEDQPEGSTKDVHNGDNPCANNNSNASEVESTSKEDECPNSANEDALFEDFMAELRKARERVTTNDDTPGEEADDGAKSSIKAASCEGKVDSAAVSIENNLKTANLQPQGTKTELDLSSNATVDDDVKEKDIIIASQPDLPVEKKKKKVRKRQRHIKDMSVLSVSQTLKSMGLPYVAKVFEDEKIDGEVAQFLDDDLLRNQLKILTVSERQRTMEWISQYY